MILLLILLLPALKMANALEKSDAVVKGGDYNNDHGSSMALLVEGGNRDDGVQERLLVEATVQMIRKQLFGCHLVLASTNKQSSFFSSIVRELIGRGVAAGVVVSGETLSQSPTNNAQSYKHHRKRAGLWQGGEATCKVLIFDYTTNDTYTAKRIAEWAGLWTRPDSRVVGVGGRDGVAKLLLNHAFRNTRHALYLTAIPSSHLHRKGSSVIVWRRCSYCVEGESGVEILGRWNQTTARVPGHISLFRDRPENYNGHRFRIVEKDYFPYSSWVKVGQPKGGLGPEVRLQDSLGTRMINTVATYLNFTYIVREPVDGQWGLESEAGKWTGIVGTLQREDADLSLDLTITPKRTQVIQFTKTYIDESVVLLSSKPRPLPEYLSLIRPFEWEVWLAMSVSVVVWGVSVWLLQKVWPCALGGLNLNLSSSIFYGWGLLLEDPPEEPPSNLTGQMAVGWWLAACLVLGSSYRSSLISHLVVAGKSPVINTVEDLVGRHGWGWGTPRMTGALKTVLSTSPDLAMQKLYKEMQVKSIEDGMGLVLKGGFAFIYSTYYGKMLVATHYTDQTGDTPVHISTSQYDLFFGNSFGMRPGAPHLSRMSLALQWLMEAGLVSYWIDDVIADRVRETRRQQTHTEDDNISISTQERDGNQVVLRLTHLQGAFLMLILGHGIGCVAFILEYIFRGPN